MCWSGITRSVAQVCAVIRVTTSVTGLPAATVTTSGSKPLSVTWMATRFGSCAAVLGADWHPASSANAAIVHRMLFMVRVLMMRVLPPVSSNPRPREQGCAERGVSINGLQAIGDERDAAHHAQPE